MKKALSVLAVTLVACNSGGSGYSGHDLSNDVQRVLDTTRSVSCDDTPKVKQGVITDCWMTNVPSSRYRVTFDDDKGHFHLEESN